MFALTLVMVCIVFGATAQIMMKRGMTQIGEIKSIDEFNNPNTILQIFTNPYVLLGLFLYAVSAFLWLGALSTLDVSFMYPLLSFGYVLTAIFALVFLKEYISVIRWAGILLVVIGCFLITRS
jgi:drug/metabolite transporter (DMT)-like permease